MCYITYIVPKSALPPLALPGAQMVESEPQIYPDGFVPEWFLQGGFPEDE